MPIKEQCLNAIDVIARYCNEVKQGHIPPRFELTNELDVLIQLINEHFDNPPLKFEELENSWVWDNKYKGYIFVGNYRKLSKRYRMFHINDEDILYLTEDDFEENRFYRKEVKE